eukprot:scaffold470_cov257-Pinguiococcus_pyrenoidosus.AAC.21
MVGLDRSDACLGHELLQVVHLDVERLPQELARHREPLSLAIGTHDGTRTITIGAKDLVLGRPARAVLRSLRAWSDLQTLRPVTDGAAPLLVVHQRSDHANGATQQPSNVPLPGLALLGNEVGVDVQTAPPCGVPLAPAAAGEADGEGRDAAQKQQEYRKAREVGRHRRRVGAAPPRRCTEQSCKQESEAAATKWARFQAKTGAEAELLHSRASERRPHRHVTPETDRGWRGRTDTMPWWGEANPILTLRRERRHYAPPRLCAPTGLRRGREGGGQSQEQGHPAGQGRRPRGRNRGVSHSREFPSL